MPFVSEEVSTEVCELDPISRRDGGGFGWGGRPFDKSAAGHLTERHHFTGIPS